jgi:uridine kinase
MFTISDKTRQLLSEAFDKNEELSKLYDNWEKTPRQMEEEYLEQKKLNPDLELPSYLKFMTFTGIQEQIDSCEMNEAKNSETVVGFLGFYIYLHDNTECIEKFLIEKT